MLSAILELLFAFFNAIVREAGHLQGVDPALIVLVSVYITAIGKFAVHTLSKALRHKRK